jgi:preprotein translocase SecE subunit
VARDRQRAKQRRARREKQGQGGVPAPTQPTRENVPDELEHASAESELFEAKLISEAGGEVAPEGAVEGVGGEPSPEQLSDEQFDELEDDVDEVEEAFESGDQAAIAHATAEAEGDGGSRAARRRPSADAPTEKGGLRFIAFLRACWAELQRVQWPDRRQVGQATAVVLGFVVVAGLYLGLADAASNEIVNWII